VPAFPLAYHDFRLFWLARLATMLAQSGIVLSIGWQVYDIARRTMDVRQAAFWLGLIGLVQFVPVFCLTPISGVVADRIDRRHLARLSLVLQLLGACGLGLLNLMGRTGLPALFTVAVMLGAARAFYMPAMNALAPNLVPRAVLPQAIAINAVAGRMGAILGPILGGFAYARAPHFAFGLSALLLCGSLTCVSLIRARVASVPRAAGPLAQMAEGWRYVAANRLLLGMISLDLFAVLLGGAGALLPVFARDILMTGPAGLGYLRAAPALGATAAALYFAWRPPGRHFGLKMLGSVAVYGLAILGFGLSRSLELSLGLLALSGLADMVSVVLRQSLMQLYTPDAMRGRVGAISTLFISASNELGEAESGFLAAAIGPVGAVVAGGVGAVLVAVGWARLFPELARAEPPAPEQR